MNTLIAEIDRIPNARIYGRVTDVFGLLIEMAGAPNTLSVGDRCRIVARDQHVVACEVIGFRNGRALLMPFGPVEGIGIGSRIEIGLSRSAIYPHSGWLGRVVDAMGQPIDGKGAIVQGLEPYPLRASPPPAHQRQRVGERLDLGVRVLNTFTTCCLGQRMGIFSASGVGKSVLLSMLARFTESDVNVIGLIGERGREVQEFITEYLGEEGLARTVLVVATSDETPLMRRQAGYMTLAVAEYFRDQGHRVLCMMDSVTRFAQAQREIGLSAGEPPTTKGYTPTVFSELPRLLERAGPGVSTGSITGLFTVLVEGDDHDEPVADAVRGILDGHIVLERSIAERGRFPAVNVLRSVSRTMPGCNGEEEARIVNRARSILSTYEDMSEMIRLGAYRAGSDDKVDQAIKLYAPLEAFLSQPQGDRGGLAESFAELAQILERESVE